jgi:hypothetical protein
MAMLGQNFMRCEIVDSRSGVAEGKIVLGMQVREAKSGDFCSEDEGNTFFRNGGDMPLSFQKTRVFKFWH